MTKVRLSESYIIAKAGFLLRASVMTASKSPAVPPPDHMAHMQSERGRQGMQDSGHGTRS